MSSVIEAIDVCKTFGEQRVSKNISLKVAEGSIYGLLGPNGAGKTTLIRMLSTIPPFSYTTLTLPAILRV